LRLYGIIEMKSNSKEHLEKILNEHEEELKRKYKDKIKIVSKAEPKKEDAWYYAFLEIEYIAEDLKSLIKFVSVESPAFLEIESDEDIEIDSKELEELLSKISSLIYTMKKLLNLHLVTYNEEGDSKWIEPELAEDLCMADEATGIMALLCEIDVAEIDDAYIKPLFNTVSGFYPFSYQILDQKKFENYWVLAVKVFGTFKKPSTIFYTITTFSPSEIEIHSPDKIKFEISDLQDGLSVLSSVLATLKAMIELKTQTRFQFDKHVDTQGNK